MIVSERGEAGDIFPSAFEGGFRAGVATLKPVRFKTYAAIRKSIKGSVSQGTSVVTMAGRVAAAGDAMADMRDKRRRITVHCAPHQESPLPPDAL